jgi:hypothetical protein
MILLFVTFVHRRRLYYLGRVLERVDSLLSGGSHAWQVSHYRPHPDYRKAKLDLHGSEYSRCSVCTPRLPWLVDFWILLYWMTKLFVRHVDWLIDWHW